MKYPTEAGIVHLEAEGEKNESGRQFFWAHWVEGGRKRGQGFFADMDKHIGYWKDRGWKVIVEPNARPHAEAVADSVQADVGRCVSCCGEAHEIIQWTDAGPKQYGAECSICGRRIAEENPAALIAAFAAANAEAHGGDGTRQLSERSLP